MRDPRIAYEPDDEVEAHAIEGLLEEEGIPYSLRRKADTAYPGIVDRAVGWGEIRVEKEDLDRAQALIAGWLEAEGADGGAGPYREGPEEGEEAYDEDRSTPLERAVKKGFWRILLYGAFGTSLAFNVGYCSMLRGGGLEAGAPQGEFVVEDATGAKLLVSEFEDGADFPLRIEDYDVRGRRLSSHYDRDSDGRAERSVVYHDDGKRSVFEDADEDGLFEHFEVRRAGELLSTTIDADGDQLYERFEAGDLTALDEDADGFPERIECQAADGAVRRFDAVACEWR